jgi:hypothetical protein
LLVDDEIERLEEIVIELEGWRIGGEEMRNTVDIQPVLFFGLKLPAAILGLDCIHGFDFFEEVERSVELLLHWCFAWLIKEWRFGGTDTVQFLKWWLRFCMILSSLCF